MEDGVRALPQSEPSHEPEVAYGHHDQLVIGRTKRDDIRFGTAENYVRVLSERCEPVDGRRALTQIRGDEVEAYSGGRRALSPLCSAGLWFQPDHICAQPRELAPNRTGGDEHKGLDVLSGIFDSDD